MNNNYGSNLKRIREQHNISGEQLGIIIGVGKSTISNYENGSRKIPLESAILIAQYFNITLDSLLGLENENLIDVSNLDLTIVKSLKSIIEGLKKNGQ